MNERKRSLRRGLIYATPVACLLLLIIFLNSTNPLQTGPLGVLAVFILLYLLIFSALCVIFRTVSSIVRMVLKPQRMIALRKGYYLMSVVSLAPVLLVALNTLGRLDVLEIVLII